MKEIIVATQNKHKIEEIDEITKRFGFKTISRRDAGVADFEIEEDGETFEENSYKKAYEIMKVSGKITIADDSGLEVDALGRRPGVYSARYAGEEATDADNNEKLLRELADVPFEKRTARYVSVITMIMPETEKVIVARGEVEGHIAFDYEGNGGFGYDPLFIPEGFEHTFGTFTMEEKNKISHRGRALEILAAKLEKEGYK